MNLLVYIVIICVVLFSNEVQPNNFPSADTIIVQKAGKLIMINEKGIELRTLEIKHKVFDFVWVNSELLIYTSLKKKNMNVYQYDMRKNISKKLAELTPKNKNKDFWIRGEQGDLLISEVNLIIPCDLVCVEGCGAGASYIINLGTNKITYNKAGGRINQETENIYNKIRLKKYDPYQKNILNSLSIGDNCELYYSNGSTKNQISNTPYQKRKFNEECIFFNINPKANKVVFSIVEDFMEGYFGKTYIVNLDGSDQQLISEQFYGFIAFASISTGFSYVLDYTHSDLNNLRAITVTNTPKLIISDIEDARLCEENSWSYTRGNIIH